jgi:hypothetical protein
LSAERQDGLVDICGSKPGAPENTSAVSEAAFRERIAEALADRRAAIPADVVFERLERKQAARAGANRSED